MNDVFDDSAKHIKWISECDEYQKKYNGEEEKVVDDADILKHEYSKFNLNQIGRLLAELLTEVKSKEYFYIRGNNFVTHCNWESDHPEVKQVKYTTAIISSDPARKFLVTSAHNNKFIFPEDIIVLSNSEEYEDEVYFYDEEGKFLISNYPYIRKYIDELIEERMNSALLEKKDGKVKKKTKKAD